MAGRDRQRGNSAGKEIGRQDRGAVREVGRQAVVQVLREADRLQGR